MNPGMDSILFIVKRSTGLSFYPLPSIGQIIFKSDQTLLPFSSFFNPINGDHFQRNPKMLKCHRRHEWRQDVLLIETFFMS